MDTRQLIITGVLPQYAGGLAVARIGGFSSKTPIDAQGNFNIPIRSTSSAYTVTLTPNGGSPYSEISTSVVAGPGVTNITAQVQALITLAGPALGIPNASTIGTNAQGNAVAGVPAIAVSGTSPIAKMRALSAAADISNLIDNPVTSAATVTPLSSTPSLTGYTDYTPALTGFAGRFTGVTTIGSNIVSVTSGVTGTILVGQPILTNGRSTTIDVGSVVTSVTPATGTPTSLTMSKPAIGSGTGLVITTASTLFDIIGGVAGGASNNMSVIGAVAGNGPNPPTAQTNTPAPFAFEFYTDAANFSTSSAGILAQFFTNGVTPTVFRVAVDGAYQSSDVQTFGNGYISIQFAVAGIHKVRIEVQPNIVLLHMQVLTPAKIWRASSSSNIHVAFFGDSYFLNGAVGSFSMRNVAATTANLMGWTPDFLAVGGTGYVNSGGVNYAWTSPFRLNNILNRNYDAIVVFGSVNDAGALTTTLNAAALTTWKGIRANNPTATMFIFGIPTTVNFPIASSGPLEAVLQTAFATWGDPNSYFIPMSNDPEGPWITPGNAAIYIASDGTHPTDGVGTVYTGKKMAQKLHQILAKQTF